MRVRVLCCDDVVCLCVYLYTSVKAAEAHEKGPPVLAQYVYRAAMSCSFDYLGRCF